MREQNGLKSAVRASRALPSSSDATASSGLRVQEVCRTCSTQRVVHVELNLQAFTAVYGHSGAVSPKMTAMQYRIFPVLSPITLLHLLICVPVWTDRSLSSVGKAANVRMFSMFTAVVQRGERVMSCHQTDAAKTDEMSLVVYYQRCRVEHSHTLCRLTFSLPRRRRDEWERKCRCSRNNSGSSARDGIAAWLR
ncbi:hypothetical protein Q8A73_000266 [Channa argus]|nr:hypothetical protein Q8A73_000266 [Channa argus]